jgi:hypothetical protein
MYSLGLDNVGILISAQRMLCNLTEEIPIALGCGAFLNSPIIFGSCQWRYGPIEIRGTTHSETSVSLAMAASKASKVLLDV